jgi:hypothetical protein
MPMTKRSKLFAPIDDAPSCEPAAERIAVRWLPVEALRPDERNARVHSHEQVARIAASIAAFGFNAPFIVDEEGGVLAGHGRVLAAKRLGLKEVPAIALDHLGEAQRRAFMIADNRLAELAFWDEGRLRLELEELKNLDLDFAVDATGFTMEEIDLRIEGGRAPGGKRREQRASSPSGSAVTRAGDTWTLGPHRLVCGDDPGAGAFSALDAGILCWQAKTGKAARLHPGGESFRLVAQARGKPLSRWEAGRGEAADAARERQ